MDKPDIKLKAPALVKEAPVVGKLPVVKPPACVEEATNVAELTTLKVSVAALPSVVWPATLKPPAIDMVPPEDIVAPVGNPPFTVNPAVSSGALSTVAVAVSFSMSPAASPRKVLPLTWSLSLSKTLPFVEIAPRAVTVAPVPG
mmetsp:Transcript_47021/g.109612  ORF Transcript_47021/g.109612 Transcript_47021/m.109612 type:complete len:144 (+) Transcript_47021:291-722(+)